MFADVGDQITAQEGVGQTLAVSGPESAGAPNDHRNSILQAAQFLRAENLSLTLEKNLPTAAGIGGGSADAAAAINAICALRKLEIPADVLVLGADVPVCMRGAAARMRGIGQDLQPIPNLPEIACVLVNPRVGVSTPQVFSALNIKNNPPMPDSIPHFSMAAGLAQWLSQQRNDLEAPAKSIEPIIGTVLQALQSQPRALMARMSGSGATCFALFETINQAREAAESLVKSHPDWWVKPARLT